MANPSKTRWKISTPCSGQNKKGGPVRRAFWLLLLTLTIFRLFGGAPAIAHGGTVSSAGEARGIEIAALNHGDMALLFPYRAAIISLAERQTETDETLRRLLNFTKLQIAYCFWGLVPDAVSDEESMFNECSHAYLAGAAALLNNLQTRPQARTQALAIKAAIEGDRAAAPWLVLCAYSSRQFYTGQIISPIWSMLAQYGYLPGVFLLFVTLLAMARTILKSRRGMPT